MIDEDKKVVDIVKGNEERIKKWEPKKKVQLQTNEVAKEIVQEKGSGFDATKQFVVLATPNFLLLGMIMKPTTTDSLDMLSMLSQINVQVPLSLFLELKNIRLKL